jgi:hypothetical protein
MSERRTYRIASPADLDTAILAHAILTGNLALGVAAINVMMRDAAEKALETRAGLPTGEGKQPADWKGLESALGKDFVDRMKGAQAS